MIVEVWTRRGMMAFVFLVVSVRVVDILDGILERKVSCRTYLPVLLHVPLVVIVADRQVPWESRVSPESA